MPDELLSREEGPVHRLTLNRPARRNALTPDLAGEIARELDLIEERGAAQVVVLAGAGGHFCAGLDLHWLRSLGPVPSTADLQRGLSLFQSAVLAIVRCPLPVVAEIRGSAAGFGLDLALACDMRLAESGATFTSAFARMGLVPDGGSSFTIPRLTGLGHALRFLLAGETLSAARAAALGLVDEVKDEPEFDAAVAALTRGIVAAAPASVRTIKRLIRAQEVGALEQALASEGAAQIQALQSPEFHRRLEAFVSR
ncbi:MAG TPA: enoyl-CoA hydratase/isomerase family protein [Gemmatimonadales bacterium]|jgi:enoyl-CoA hydratase/carnithine racemase|nr:enoyl-CoA hydratase/isomerase family protein [Gemmatimonadales bacterium]